MKRNANPPFKWAEIYDALFQIYGETVCPLKHDSPFQLLAAVMLSAQCRDDRVNMVTGALFEAGGTPEKMAELPVEKIAEFIHTLGLYATKAKHLSECAKMICRDFNGEVPQNMTDLLKLPGIGRKSANVILGNAFHIPGFPVDTHVKRLLNRMGMVKSDSPEEIEKIACAGTPPERWTNFSHILIFHGRQVCHAGNPECGRCPLKKRCPGNKLK